MKFDEEIVHFNIFDKMKHSIHSHSVFVIHAINPTIWEFLEFNCKGKLKVVVNKHHGLKATYEVKMGKKLKKTVALCEDLKIRLYFLIILFIFE